MPPPSEISGFDPRFLRPCIFPAFRQLDYGVRPTINNGLSADHQFAADLSVSLSLFDDSGAHRGTSGEIARLAPGEIQKYELDELLGRPEIRERISSDGGGDQLGILHLVPTRYLDQAEIDAKPAEMMAHVQASDDFIEFHQKPKGVVTGVAYQTGPKNDPRMGSTMTTVVQAPKVIVGDNVDTLFSLMNVSTRFDYHKPVGMEFWILGADGSRIARGSIEVPAWTFRFVSATDVLESAGALDAFRAQGGMGMFLGYAKEGTLIPLSFTRNKQSGAIACDHTLPPPFYVTTWGGEARLRANARLEQEFFADSVEPVTASEEVASR